MPMNYRLHLLAVTGFALLSGCRACSGSDDPAASSSGSLRQQQSDRARLMSRLNARKLDRDKTYPKDADGNVLCAADADCFVLQSERCAPASFSHVQTVTGYGLTQRIQAHYRIEASEGERCKVERDVLAVDARVDEKMAEALYERGKQEGDIERIEADAIAALVKKHPSRLECSFSSDQALEVGLNLAEGRYDLRLWHDNCRSLSGPMPSVGVQELPGAPVQAEGEDHAEGEGEAALEQAPGEQPAAAPGAAAEPAQQARRKPAGE